MTRKQMLKMLGKRPSMLRAIRVAIRKHTELPWYWGRMTARKNAGAHWPCAKNCSLCEYVNRRKLTCAQCWLKGRYQCDVEGSPYDIMNHAIETRDYRLFMFGRDRMLKRLWIAERIERRALLRYKLFKEMAR